MFFSTSAHYIPTANEDASFYGPLAMGVSDGVGGWAEQGGDAGLYARTLMRGAMRAVSSDARAMMQAAYDQMPPDIQGTATATVVVLVQSQLCIANLGDSGVLVLRAVEGVYHVALRTRAQQHDFNCPFQLGTHSPDTPANADTYDLALDVGDVVVVATDGVFDNLFECEIVQCLDARDPASAIATAAYQKSKDKKATTPFSISASVHNFPHRGGKPDDITCLVGVVTHGGPR